MDKPLTESDRLASLEQKVKELEARPQAQIWVSPPYPVYNPNVYYPHYPYWYSPPICTSGYVQTSYGSIVGSYSVGSQCIGANGTGFATSGNSAT